MEDVNEKSESQLKNILDDLVDYKNHSSQKELLMKELAKTKTTTSPPQDNNKTNFNHKLPGASLNSSTYSSAASSSSSSESSSSSSTSSSPSQSQNGIVSKSSSSNNNNNNNRSTTTTITISDNIIKNLCANDEVELAKMVELGKKAKYLEICLRDPSDTLQQQQQQITSKTSSSTLNNASENLDYSEMSKSNGDSNKFATIYKSNEPDTMLLSSLNNDSSWKTKRDKRRKKPIEKEIKAGEIPGNIGHRTVEELEDFIKSGTNATSNNSNKNKNNKSKTPNNNSNIISNHNYNIATTNNIQNANSSNVNKKVDNNAINNNKSNHMSSRMNNHVQNKNPPQQLTHNQPQSMVTQNFQQQLQNKQPIQSDNSRENNHHKGTAKPNQQFQQQQPKQTHTNQPARQQQQTQQQQHRRIVPPTSQQNQQSPKQQTPQQPQQQKQNQTKPIQISQSIQENQQQAVVFANHIQVRDDDNRQYVFGFFDEQGAQNQPENATKSEFKIINLNQNSQNNNSRKPPSSTQPETRQKMKQLKPSPFSEVTRKPIDKIDVNSFNFDDILKFISDSWQQTQTKKSSNMHKY